MYLIPRQVNATEYVVLVVLQQENVDRIREQNPVELGLRDLPTPWSGMKCRDVVITFAAQDDFTRVKALCEEGKPGEAFRLVTRGRKNRPEGGGGTPSELIRVARFEFDGEEMETRSEAAKPTVHLLAQGRALCGFHADEPGNWPPGHLWLCADPNSSPDLPPRYVVCVPCKTALKELMSA
jgi:hypothetical protein